MTKKRSVGARKDLNPTVDENSLLIKSAETVGRAVGTLERIVGSATGKLSSLPAAIGGPEKKTQRKSGVRAGKTLHAQRGSARRTSASSSTGTQAAKRRSRAKRAKRQGARKA